MMASPATQEPSSTGSTPVQALIFDCDGVIVESEGIHREAYNAAFKEFNVICPGEDGPLVWTEEFYDVLQNTVGGGKPKMRWYFGKHGWPTTTILEGGNAPTQMKRRKRCDTLQDWKTQKYKDIIKNGVAARPGIERIMDEARARGIPVAAGDDVTAKKPDPMIYNEAAARLGADPSSCLVIEDSVIGLQAATGAGMSCVITYTSSTKDQEFDDALAVFRDMTHVNIDMLLQGAYSGFDSRTFQSAE
eukprot:jgi/Picre1/29928/NNA_005306.t1